MRILFMRMSLMTITLGTMCWAAAGARDSNPAPNQKQPTQPSQGQSTQPSGPTRIAAGSVIPVQLTKTVDAKKAKAGEEVDVKVTEDMKTRNGEILIPKDTRIVGHVTQVQARNKEQHESQLGITFDRAVMKDGDSLTLPASIQAVIAPPTQNPDNANADGGGTAAPAYAPGSAGGRPGMAGEPQQQVPSSSPAGADQSANTAANSKSKPMPAITSSTQGVIGISNYKLSTPGDVTQGSVVSSEKGNVKLESGTLMLLRVNL